MFRTFVKNHLIFHKFAHLRIPIIYTYLIITYFYTKVNAILKIYTFEHEKSSCLNAGTFLS